MNKKSEQIADALLQDIRAGKYENRLPSEKAIAELYHTSPVTAAKSLNLLRDRRVVTRVSGKGSFVNSAGMRQVKLHLEMPEEIQTEISEALKQRFGDAVELSRDYCEGFWDEYDMFFRTAYVPFECSLKLSPLPGNFLEYVYDSNYYGKAFGAHFYHGRYYGVPYIISPVLLAVNLNLLDRIGISMPRRGFAPAALKDLRNRLDQCGANLFDTLFYNKSLLLSFMFARLRVDTDAELTDMTLYSQAEWKQLLEDFDAIVKPDIAAKADFEQGNTLFRLMARQDIVKNSHKFKFDWDIAPLPFGDKSPPTLAGEYIMISNSNSNPSLCHEVAEFFLNKQIQDVFARHRYGLPVLKSAALGSMDTSKYRDDLFFSGAEHTVYRYHLMDKAFLNPMLDTLSAYFNGATVFPELLSQTVGLYELDRLNHDKAVVSILPDTL